MKLDEIAHSHLNHILYPIGVSKPTATREERTHGNLTTVEFSWKSETHDATILYEGGLCRCYMYENGKKISSSSCNVTNLHPDMAVFLKAHFSEKTEPTNSNDGSST